MEYDNPTVVVIVAVLIVAAALLSAVDAALNGFSRSRADALRAEGRAGSKALVRIACDPPRYLNTVLLLRIAAEVSAIVLTTLLVSDLLGTRGWAALLTVIGAAIAASFVVIGVAPRTLGRQHADGIALASAGAVLVLARVVGPAAYLLIQVGNAITPGKGFAEGPFSTEAELRELVDLAEASAVIESDERAMIHSVFEFGDTIVREVMVPRTDVVYIERTKTLRQAMSLFLRSGFSRVPVVGEGLDDVLGFAYLKDVSRRVFDNKDAEMTESVESVMRPVAWVPDSKPVDDLLKEMQASRRHVAVVVDEYGGTAGLVTIEDLLEEIVGEITDEFDQNEIGVEQLEDGSWRVPARFLVDDLDELLGVKIEDDEVDSVGGLLAKCLGKVPIPGSAVDVAGLRLCAEEAKGRRNKIGTVLITPIPLEEEPAELIDEAASAAP